MSQPTLSCSDRLTPDNGNFNDNPPCDNATHKTLRREDIPEAFLSSITYLFGEEEPISLHEDLQTAAIMLENIFVNVRNHSAKMTGSLSVDNLKEHTAKFSDSLDSLRSKLRTNSTRVTTYLSSVNQDNYVDQPYADLNIDRDDPHNQHSDDEENIVGKFIRVITIDDDDQPNQPFPMAANHRNRRRNDREEIRRRLAMGPDVDEYFCTDRPGRKPSLQARLQSGMNLQICFMNETLSDTESPSSEGESRTNIIDSSVPVTAVPKPETEVEWIKESSHLSMSAKPERPLTLPLRLSDQKNPVFTEADFLERQAQLQAEARVALVQAKDMAHMQMEMERQRMNASPITEMIRNSLQKVGVHFLEDRRRLSRQILTEMNVAQLQVIVNDLHTQIEYLNEKLVKLLIQRDDLHMEQDSMLVDIEDLTRYLGAKDQALNQNNNLLSKHNSEITGVTTAK